MHALENPNKADIGVMVADFERLCSEEQSFGVEVERTIHKIDELTQRDVMRAEADLGACRAECDALRDRLQRALKGGTPNSSDLVSAHAQDESHTDAAATRVDPKPFIFSTSSSPNPSLPSTPLDADAFSVISDLSDESPILEEPSDVTPCDDSVTHVNTNPTAYLASLIEHGISLCEARRSLEEEVLKRLETKENSYLDAVEGTKSLLATTRRDAVDIVKRLKVASGNIISIILPWNNEVEAEGCDPEKKSHAPTASPSTLIPAMPIYAYPEQVPPPTIVAPMSTFTPASLTLDPCSTTVANSCLCAAPLDCAPVSPSSLLMTLAPEPTPSTTLPCTACSTSTINPPVPATSFAVPPPSLNVQEHQELFQCYEERMHAAKGTEYGALCESMVPWPVLIPQFHLPSTDSSLSATTNLQDFISLYSQWKQLSLEETSTIMLNDWVLILGKVEKRFSRKKLRRKIERVISQLRIFSNDTISVAN